jgi:hypothetical protein
MTMPCERRRALRWARATLKGIHNDAGASPEVKAEAGAALAAFPDDRAVATCFLEQDDDNLARHLVAIEAAQKVLWRASGCPELSEQTRIASEATDRHFPQCWELSEASWTRSPRDWVELYLLRDMDAEAMWQELLQLGITNIDAACARLARSGRPRPETL